jgi:hypothetical protein
MTSSPRLTLTYTVNAEAGASEPSLNLEQAAVSKGNVTMADLYAMLALVRSGVSARTYLARDCAARVVGGAVLVDLTAYVWPSALDLAYTLAVSIPAWTVIGPAVEISQWRDFDLVVPMSAAVELPFLAADLSLVWQTPCYNRYGEAVAAPAIDQDGLALRLDSEVFGVIRVRCRAMGFQHTLALTIPKGTSRVEDIDLTLIATWPISNGTEVEDLDLQLPGCVEDLLATCEDGTLVAEVGGSVSADDPRQPVVYWNPCEKESNVIEVRYE